MLRCRTFLFTTVMMMSTGFWIGEASATCSGVTCASETITRFYVHTNGTLFFGVEGDTASLSCETGSGGYLRITKSSAMFGEIYALLLTAKMSGRRVTIRLPSQGVCSISYVFMDD